MSSRRTSLQEAYPTLTQGDETNPKSGSAHTGLELPVLREGVRYQENFSTAIGYRTPNMREILPGQLGDTSQDVSLHSNLGFPRRDPVPMSQDEPPHNDLCLTRRDPAPISDAEQRTDAGSAGEADQSVTMQMNILPSRVESRMNNIAIPLGMAERQSSFREIPSSVYIPPAMPASHHQSPASLLTLTPSALSNASNGYVSRQRNVERRPETTNRPSSGANQVSYDNNISNNNDVNNSSTSSVVSMRSEIMPDCLVRRLPVSVLDVLEDLEDTNHSFNWMRLVENYGWNYEQSVRFARKHKNGNIFLALLKVEPFQLYTLSQLRADLDNLPRKDLLLDLDEAIAGHNAKAAGNSR